MHPFTKGYIIRGKIKREYLVNYSYGEKLLNHVISIQVHAICLLKKSICNMTSMRFKLSKMHPNTDLLVKFRDYSIKQIKQLNTYGSEVVIMLYCTECWDNNLPIRLKAMFCREENVGMEK